MKLYLLRHGTTTWNALRRIQGCTDIPLDETGEEIARLTGLALKEAGLTFDACYSSPLERALRTAALVAPDTPAVPDPRLSELSFGDFEGQEVKAMESDETCPFRYFHADPPRYDKELLALEASRPGEGFESLTSLCKRTGDFLDKVISPLARQMPENARILLSGHGAMNRGLLMHLRGESDLSAFWGKGLQANCAITIATVTVEDGRVSYETDDTCQIFYDPDLVHIPSLL